MIERPTDHGARAIFDAASDHYDDPANAFCARAGSRTVHGLELRPGSHVLDVCCGTGASAIPAAEVVGAFGSVLGVDLAEDMLAVAREKAERSGHTNVEFRTGDLLDLGLPDDGFDAVICAFGIFVAPDLESAARELWRLVKPGGTLAITSWGPRLLEPMNSRFWGAVRHVRPELFKSSHPWERISEPGTLRAMLGGAGISAGNVVLENASQILSSGEDWWRMVLGSDYRGTIDQLDTADRERVRRDNLDYIREAGVTSVETNVIYATATKPSNPRR
jgi:ubiquinone/menaquinone biosynthesis C-methylase UbiE